MAAIDTDNQLVSVDDALSFIGIPSDDTRMEKLQFYINAASWYCNKHTRRKLKSRSLTEYYNGDGTNVLLMKNYPITAITHIYDDLSRAYGSDTEIDSSNLVYMPEDLACKLVYDGGVFSVGIRNIKAEYTAGYTTIPYDLRQACLELVAYYWKNTEEGRFGLISQQLADGSVRLETTTVPKSVLQVLDLYRKKW